MRTRRLSALSLQLTSVLAITILVLPMASDAAFAQQAGYPQQYPGTPQPGYPQQYPGAQQPGYAQRQPYPPSSPYTQQAFTRQPYAQPSSLPQQQYAQPGYSPQLEAVPRQEYSQQRDARVQPLNAQQLEQLVAPIALYPDTLVAQVLAASTYPAQVVNADRWRQAQGNADANQVAGGADMQPWDPAVKSLTAVPEVLANLDHSLQWTIALGNAYYNQPQDVLEAVQVMRQRAEAAGSLEDTPQQAVSYNQGNIVLASADPQTVYVPRYDPSAVYGEPVSPYPGFSPLNAISSFLGSSPIQFGLGIAMTAFTHMNWGVLGWGLNWLAETVLFNHSDYASHSTTVADFGFPYGGPRAFSNGRSGGRFAGAFAGQGFESNSSRGSSFGRAPDRFAYSGGRSSDGYNNGYNRSSQQAYAHVSAGLGSSQQYGRFGYGSSTYSRSGAGYSSTLQSARGAAANFDRGTSSQRSSNTFPGRGSAESSNKQAHSGGFHLFGGGHSDNSYKGSSSFSGGHSSGSSHSIFGGHSSESSHSIFGGHSSGSSHSSGGSSHSGGGSHSSSGHHH